MSRTVGLTFKPEKKETKAEAAARKKAEAEAKDAADGKQDDDTEKS